MNHIKFLLTGCLAALAMTTSAQTNTTYTTNKADTTATAAKKSFFSNTDDYDRAYHIMPEVKLGSCYGVAGFGANIVLEHEFHKYLAWDIASLEFAAPFKFDAGDFSLKTGLRGFTPRFWDEKARGFMSVAAGYDCGVYDEIKELRDGWFPIIKKEPHHGFGLTWGIGMQFMEHFFVGYTLEYSTAWKFTAHYGKFGYRF